MGFRARLPLHAGAFALLALIPILSPSVAGASGVVGVHKLTLQAGANFISIPFHHRAAFVGSIQSVADNTVTMAGTSSLTPGQFGPRDGIPQYVMVITRDASESPGVEGDWWHVTDNGVSSVVVDTMGEALPALLAAGDGFEVRKLTSIQDVFGAGSNLSLHKDSNFDVLISEEDVIRIVEGTSFTHEIFYHDGSEGAEGYYLDGELVGSGDGSTITLNPNQPIMVFRKTGSPPLTLAVAGSVQTTRLTHYLGPGANAVGVTFPVEVPLATSALKESGWVSDVNFDILTIEEDIIRAVVGTAFAEEIFHYEGPDDVHGWYVNGALNPAYVFQPTRGYMFFLKGPAPLRWRQDVPY